MSGALQLNATRPMGAMPATSVSVMPVAPPRIAMQIRTRAPTGGLHANRATARLVPVDTAADAMLTLSELVARRSESKMIVTPANITTPRLAHLPSGWYAQRGALAYLRSSSLTEVTLRLWRASTVDTQLLSDPVPHVIHLLQSLESILQTDVTIRDRRRSSPLATFVDICAPSVN